MTLTTVPEVLALLDGLSVTGGGHSLTFSAVANMRHLDRNSYAVDRGLISAVGTRNPTRPSDTGGRAAQNEETVEVIALWEDAATLTDPEVFREAVVAGITAAVRGQQTGLGPAWWAYVADVVNEDAPLAGGRGVRFGVRLFVQALGVEVYA